MTRFVVSLLQTLNVDPALVGDLLEQRHRGRSRLWFARQGVVAALARCAATWVSHPVLALRSLALGGAAAFLLTKAVWVPMQATSRLFGLYLGNYLLETDHESVRYAFMQFHLYDLPVVLFQSLTYGMAGWLLAHTLRPQHAAMLVLFAVAVPAWWAYDLTVWTRGAMLVPKMNLYPYIQALSFCVLTPSILFGGMKGLRRT